MAAPSTNMALLITGMVILLVILGIAAALRVNWCAGQILLARRARREARAARRAAQSSAGGGDDADTTVVAAIV